MIGKKPNSSEQKHDLNRDNSSLRDSMEPEAGDLVTAASAQKPQEQSKKKAFLTSLFEPKNSGKLAALLVILGVVVTLYPVIATLIMNQSQNAAVQTVKKAAKNLAPEQREKMLKSAREYNKKLKSGPIFDPFLERVAPNTKIYQDYLKEISLDNGIMGSVTIPSIKTSLPIYHGTYDKELELGAGHLFGSSLPVGGKDTHAVITAHSGLGDATMFDYLPKVKVGDRIYLDILDKKLAYKVTSMEIVIPTDTKSLYVQPGKDLITLVTCTPYGINTHRLLVHAERIPYDPKLDQPAKDQEPPIWRFWMILPIFLCLAAIVLLYWLIKVAPQKNGSIYRRRSKAKHGKLVDTKPEIKPNVEEDF